MHPGFETDLMKMRQSDAHREGARRRLAGSLPRRHGNGRRVAGRLLMKADRIDPVEVSQIQF